MNEKKPLPVVSPESVGIPSRAIIRFLKELEANRLPMHGVLMLRHGKIAAEGYYKPFDRNRKHRMYSTSKSFVSAAIGILIGEGKLKLTDRVAQFFPDKAPPDLHPYIAQATVRDLLIMATPHIYAHCTYSDKTPDWADTYFNTPPTHLPGKIFSYDTTATVMLCILIRRITGMEFIKYLKPRLFEPAGISDDIWCIESPCGHEWGGSGILCTPRDLAKFALVCMNDGRFENQQLIPADYIRKATSRRIDNTLTATSPGKSHGYGYQFWITPNNGFACRGLGSQFAVCLPDQDFILVTTADTQGMPSAGDVIFEALWDEIFPHLQKDGSLPEDPDAYAELQKTLEGLAVLTVAGEYESSVSKSVSDKTYKMSKNDMGIKTLRFTFTNDEGVLDYENATGKHSLRFGFGRHVLQEFPEKHYHGKRIGTPAEKGYECICSAAWVMPDSLLVYCRSIDDHVGTLKMQFTFDGDTVTTLMDKHAEWFFNEYIGFASGSSQD